MLPLAANGKDVRAHGHAKGSWRRHTPAALLLLCMGGLLVYGAFTDSPTVDEPRHLSRGLVQWWYGDARMSIAHPPLANALQALPAAFSEPLVPEAELRGWHGRWNLNRTVASFLQADYPAFRGWLVAGRLVTACMSLLLALYVYLSLLPAGLTLARMSLFFLVFSPVFLAHGRLVTTDLAATAAVVLTVGETWRFLQTRKRWPLLSASLALGIAFSVKYSSLFLLPPLVVSVGLAAVYGCPRFDPALPRARRLGRAVLALATMGLVAMLVVNASYRFQRSAWTVERILAQPEPAEWLVQSSRDQTLETHSSLGAMPASLRIPLPYSYVFGLHTIKVQNKRGHGGWFFGKRQKGGSRLYLPVMLAIKNPATTFIALLLAAGIFLRRPRLPLGASTILWAAPLTFIAFNFSSRIQIGVRHSMPVLVFLLAAAAWGTTRLWERGGRSRLLGGTLLLLLVVETVGSAPRMISHFNWLIGGPSVGHRISIVGEDWGQDLWALAAFAKEEGGAFYYRRFGNASLSELRYHGVEARSFNCNTKLPEEGGWVAIHAARALRSRPDCGPFRLDRPDRVLLDHYFLYRIPGPGLQAGGDVGGVR